MTASGLRVIWRRIWQMACPSLSLRSMIRSLASWTLVPTILSQLASMLPLSAFSSLKPYQGQGLGKALLKALLTEAKAQGYIKIAMHVMGNNSRAISLYQKYGFTEEARITKAFFIENHYVDALIFAKDLENNHG